MRAQFQFQFLVQFTKRAQFQKGESQKGTTVQEKAV